MKVENILHFTCYVEQVKKYGLEEAIVLYNLIFWIRKNHYDNRNVINNKAFTFNSLRKYSECYSGIWTTRQLERIFSNISECLEVDSNNKKKYDKTKWYSLTDEMYDKYIVNTDKLDEKTITVNTEYIKEVNNIHHGLLLSVLIGYQITYTEQDKEYFRLDRKHLLNNRLYNIYSERKLNTLIKELVNNNILIESEENLNEDKWEKIKWYSLNDNIKSKYITVKSNNKKGEMDNTETVENIPNEVLNIITKNINGEMEEQKPCNRIYINGEMGDTKTVKPIPDIDSYIETYTDSYIDFSEKTSELRSLFISESVIEVSPDNNINIPSENIINNPDDNNVILQDNPEELIDEEMLSICFPENNISFSDTIQNPSHFSISLSG